jgi:multidrug efflux pump subunit AcrA (membrane-fusion protein)
VYAIMFNWTFGAAINGSYGWVNAGGRAPAARAATEPATGIGTVTAVLPLIPGNTIAPAVLQASGAARFVNANLEIYRISG